MTNRTPGRNDMTTVTDEMIEAGRKAHWASDPEPDLPDYLVAIYTAMRTLEPVSPPIDGLVERQFERLGMVEEVLRNGSRRSDDDECHPLYPQAVAARQILRAELTRLSADNAAKDAVIEQLGGGCDANGGGLHSVMTQGKESFCPDCGLMLKRVAYVLPHVKPAEARAALQARG